MATHTIRLRGPWTFIPPDAHHRAFGLPTRLDATESVWLVLSHFQDEIELFLNGESLGHYLPPTCEVEITQRLQIRNQLIVKSKQTYGEVCLEIRQNRPESM